MSDRQQTAVLMVPGMGSNHCAGLVRESICRLEGVREIAANAASHEVRVRYDVAALAPDAIRGAVENAGYDVASLRTDADGSPRAVPGDRADIEADYLELARRRLWIAMLPTGSIMLLMTVHMFLAPVPGYLAIVAVLAFPVVFLAGGFATHRSAWRSLVNRTANMDVLISLGSAPAWAVGLGGFFWPMTSFIEMAATIMAFHMLGRYLETRARGRASRAIRALLKLGAKSARVERGGEEREVALDELAVGDIMIVRPGEKIPTDGEIVEGRSHIDESIATGESVPVERGPGEAVLGATINAEGLLRVRAARIGADTFLAQVIRLVEEAQGSRVPIQDFADRMTGYFVPAVLAVAALTFAAWLTFPDTLGEIPRWGARFLPWVQPGLGTVQAAFLAAIAVLVIACPCALGLATPTALMVSSGIGAGRGILIRSGEAIQTLGDIRAIVLDKTGTITAGKPALADVVPVDGFGADELLAAAAAVETGSAHPVAGAIVAGARARGIALAGLSDFRSVTAQGVVGRVEGREILVGSRRLLSGQSVDTGPLEARLAALEAQGKTAIAVAIDGRPAGIVAVADTVKPDSAEAVAELGRLGIRVVMVTGDNAATARHVAATVGIEEVLAGVLPEGKVEAIRRLAADLGPHVAMVGDGINDAPALKQANVGIAIGAGADVAIEAADVTIVGGELMKVAEAVRLSRATFRKIRQNLFWAWAYNGAAIPIAAIGLLHPMIGVVAMTASSLSVIGNSILLRHAKL